MKKYNVKKGYEPTRKQMSFVSGRPITTVKNWENDTCKIPEHVASVKREIEVFLKAKRDQIKEFEEQQ